MSCDTMQLLVDRFTDGDLDRAETDRVEKHLAACEACAQRHRELLALRSRIHAEVPYYRAPPPLRDDVRTLAREAGRRTTRQPRRWLMDGWRWLVAGAAAGSLATIAGWIGVTAVVGGAAVDDIATAAVAAHVRATLDAKLIEVASSDQHQVKPWLSARLDYSPPVRDYAEQGFMLAGARIETLDGHRVAILVYRYRLHTIDVIVRPLPAPAPTTLRTVRGFNVAHAVGGDMDWLAVSDVNAAVLQGFVQKVASDATLP